MSMGRVTAWALATLALVGCSSAPVSPPGPSGDSSPTASPTPSTSPSAPAGPLVWLPEWVDASTPQDVVNRRPLPFCGIEEAPVPRPGEYFDATIRNCFWSAKLDRREAEFVSVQPTMEGDRIATIYRLRPDGGVDLLLDSTQDRFGGGGWTITTCESLVAAEGDQLFAPDACGEPRPL